MWIFGVFVILGGDWVSWERCAMAVSIWSILLLVSVCWVCTSAIACSMVDTQFGSMADRYELDECGLSKKEEGIVDWNCVDLSEPGVGAENWTMVWIPVMSRAPL